MIFTEINKLVNPGPVLVDTNRDIIDPKCRQNHKTVLEWEENGKFSENVWIIVIIFNVAIKFFMKYLCSETDANNYETSDPATEDI